MYDSFFQVGDGTSNFQKICFIDTALLSAQIPGV